MKGVIPAGPVLLEREEEETDLCLVCCSKVISEKYGPEKGLSCNLKVIFLLRNLLQVPDTQLERNLEEWGNPENWIRLCGPCSQLATQAEDLHCQIVEIERQLRNVRKLLVEKTRSSSSITKSSDHHDDDVPLVVDKKNQKRISIRRSTREFIFKHDYDGSSSTALSNPFIEGDSQANYLQRLQDQKAIALTIQVPQGQGQLFDNDKEDSNCSETGDDDNDDDNWKPESPKLKQIRKIEKVNGKFQCRHCDRLFNTRSGHYDHEVTKHVSKPGQYVCNICGIAWDANKSLLSHRRQVHKLTADGSAVTPKNKRIRTRVRKNPPPRKITLIVEEKERHVSSNMDFKNDNDNSNALSNPSVEGESQIKQEIEILEDQKAVQSPHGHVFDGENDNDSNFSDGGDKDGGGRDLDWKPESPKNNHQTNTPTRVLKYRKIEKINGKWKCRHCDRLFNNRISHYDHEKSKHVTKRGQYPCVVCGKAFDAKKNLSLHRRNVHRLTAKGSPFIPKTKPRDNDSNFSGGGDVEGDLDRKPDKPTKVLNIRKIEKINGKFKCRHCDRLFNNRISHFDHEVTKHVSNPGQYVCDVCGKPFDANKCLLSHRRHVHKLAADGSTVTPKAKPITCSEKRIRVRKKGGLQPSSTKRPTRSGKWKCRCRFCNEEFEHRKQRMAHEEEKHVSSDGDFKCDICGKGRDTVTRLLCHKRRVHNIGWNGKVFPSEAPRVLPKEPQTCELCGKIYSSRCGLTNHLRLIHERRSPAICHLCGYNPISEHELIRHMFGKHREEEATKKLEEQGWNIWKCEVVGCRATFLKEKGLEGHKEKYHSGPGGEKDEEGEEVTKRFACAFCGKGFWTSKRLKRHEDIHRLNGEKPWKCGECGGAFSTKQYLRDHVRRVHEINKDDDN